MLDIDFFLQKYTNLKHNYKCLEEQHYKAQERIQFLLNENKNRLNLNEDRIITQCNQKPPVSLFPCENCHKNFVSSELLKSHQQRKHSAIEEKHELSDDNEKQDGDKIEQNPKNELCLKQIEVEEPVEFINNNNNNDNESIANCNECSKKIKVTSSSVAIQCEASNIQNVNIEVDECHDVDLIENKDQTNHGNFRK